MSRGTPSDMLHPAQSKDDLEIRLAEALEVVPRIEVPDDFALRVIGSLLPADGTLAVILPQPRVGRNITLAALFVLFLLMMAFAPAAGGSSLSRARLAWLGVEWTLAAEFVILTWWISVASPLSAPRVRA